jgi:CRP-like cAMP-binding protein
MLNQGSTLLMIYDRAKNVKAVTLLLGCCKERTRKRAYLLEDKCQAFWEICHYKTNSAFINIGSMFRQGYAQLSIFADLDGDQINQLSQFIEECRFPKDYVIFEQNHAADRLYILLSGEVVVRYKPYDGPSLLVARIEPGGVFGWSAALRRDAYTSGAQAAEDSTVCCINGADLAVICRTYPETGKIFIERLASVIAERLRSTHSQVLKILTQRIEMDDRSFERSLPDDRK